MFNTQPPPPLSPPSVIHSPLPQIVIPSSLFPSTCTETYWPLPDFWQVFWVKAKQDLPLLFWTNEFSLFFYLFKISVYVQIPIFETECCSGILIQMFSFWHSYEDYDKFLESLLQLPPTPFLFSTKMKKVPTSQPELLFYKSFQLLEASLAFQQGREEVKSNIAKKFW